VIKNHGHYRTKCFWLPIRNSPLELSALNPSSSGTNQFTKELISLVLKTAAHRLANHLFVLAKTTLHNTSLVSYTWVLYFVWNKFVYHQYIYIYIYLHMYLFSCIEAYLSIYLSIYLAIHLFIYLFICISIHHPSVFVSIYKPISRCLFMYVHLSTYPPRCVSVCGAICLTFCHMSSTWHHITWLSLVIRFSGYSPWTWNQKVCCHYKRPSLR
jgi:hypothetical protein